MAMTPTTTEHFCDVGLHTFTGEAMEVRTTNCFERSDMVCLMVTCEEHAPDGAVHPHRWWQQWLTEEGAAEGYTTLS
jgi:hypothetical protein